jgi:hypothetical protein
MEICIGGFGTVHREVQIWLRLEKTAGTLHQDLHTFIAAVVVNVVMVAFDISR